MVKFIRNVSGRARLAAVLLGLIIVIYFIFFKKEIADAPTNDPQMSDSSRDVVLDENNATRDH